MDIYSGNSLKKDSRDSHVVPFGHIILILARQQVPLSLNSACLVTKRLSGKTENINLLVLKLIILEIELPTYRTRAKHANYYPTDAVCARCTGLALYCCVLFGIIN